MDKYSATEAAYKNGYKQGYEDGLRERKRKEVHAYWIGEEPGDWHCSHCGEYAADGGYEQTRYCPNCGAKMDGEETTSSVISQRTVQALERMGQKVHKSDF